MSQDGESRIRALRSRRKLEAFARALGETVIEAYDANMYGHLNPVLDAWDRATDVERVRKPNERLVDTVMQLLFRPREMHRYTGR